MNIKRFLFYINSDELKYKYILKKEIYKNFNCIIEYNEELSKNKDAFVIINDTYKIESRDVCYTLITIKENMIMNILNMIAKIK